MCRHFITPFFRLWYVLCASLERNGERRSSINYYPFTPQKERKTPLWVLAFTSWLYTLALKKSPIGNIFDHIIFNFFAIFPSFFLSVSVFQKHETSTVLSISKAQEWVTPIWRLARSVIVFYFHFDEVGKFFLISPLINDLITDTTLFVFLKSSQSDCIRPCPCILYKAIGSVKRPSGSLITEQNNGTVFYKATHI